MKDTEFAFAVAKIRANESKLLSESTLEAAINATSYAETVKAFNDAGYADFSSYDEQQILSQKQREAFELILTSAPDKMCINFLIVKNDFHNFKAVLKCMLSSKEVSYDYLLSPSVVEKDTAVKALTERRYDLLPECFRESVMTAYDVGTRTLDGQLVEVILDRASVECTLYFAKESNDDFSIKLANNMAALSDIKIALRCIRTKKDVDFMKQAFARCDILDCDKLCEVCLDGEQALAEYVKYLGFAGVSEKIGEGYAAFEKACDDCLIDYVKDAKFHCLGIAPLVAYYFASESEIKSVRIILSCKKNGISGNIIRERVRKLYV